ncbi:hypothetical protein, partial [Streptomyces fungicidicus]|uniref:hypothetical protein n=1 Tax=Streptomyces fungicidicus TaxID=68203 RepID=UPI0033DE40A3
QSKVDEGKNKLADLKKEQAADQEEKRKLESEYEVHISNLIFADAEKTKREIKDLEAKIETREDMIGILQSDQHSGIVQSSIASAKKFIEERQELTSAGESLEAKAKEKRAEYLAVLAEVNEYNNKLDRMRQQFSQVILKKGFYDNKPNSPVQWRSPEVIKDLGVDMLREASSESNKIDIRNLMIRNISEIAEGSFMADVLKARSSFMEDVNKAKASKEKNNASIQK